MNATRLDLGDDLVQEERELQSELDADPLRLCLVAFEKRLPVPESVRSLGGDDGVEDAADARPMSPLARDLKEGGGSPGDLVVGPVLEAILVAAVETRNVRKSTVEELGSRRGPEEQGKNPGGVPTSTWLSFWRKYLVVMFGLGTLFLVWITWGGFRDLLRLFRSLGASRSRPVDDTDDARFE